MNRAFARGISGTGSVRPAQLGSPWTDRVQNAVSSVEFQFPQAKKAKIKGQPHPSTKNSDQGQVVSVQLTKEDNERVGTIHVLEDGTWVMKQGGRGQQPVPGGGRNDGDKKDNDKDKDSKAQGKGSKGQAKESKGKSTDGHGRTVK